MTAVRAGRPDEARPLAALIARAFHHLGGTEYLVPEPADRQAVLTADFEILLRHFLRTGTVRAAANSGGGPLGVAVWSEHDDPGPADYDAALAAAVGPGRLERFQEFDRILHSATPDRPHAYLALLAVEPPAQSHGLGSALLAERHAELDAAGRPAFLVASAERARDLYARHGYRQCADDLVFPNDSRMYPMWRDPR